MNVKMRTEYYTGAATPLWIRVAQRFSASGKSAFKELLCVKFLKHSLAADFDFALVFAGLREIIGNLHP
jgi:hypothetical protein